LKHRIDINPAGARAGLNPTSNKSRIETGLTGFGMQLHAVGLNPTSNKSRIETAGDVNYLSGSVVSESDFQQIKD